MRPFILAATLLAAATLATPAAAYVGPGAGLSLLGAFWALVVALGTAIAFIIAWPLRKAFRRNRQATSGATEPPAKDVSGQADSHAQRS